MTTLLMAITWIGLICGLVAILLRAIWPEVGPHVDRWLRGAERPRRDEADAVLHIYSSKDRTVHAMELADTDREWFA